MFQVGLATLLFFSPQTMATATGVAAGFAVMLAPFTIVAPFAGALLDRWPRRQVLLYGNLARAAVTLVMGTVLLGTGPQWLLHVLGLLALGLNRFLLAGLSAGLPKIIGDDIESGSAKPARQARLSKPAPNLGPRAATLPTVMNAKAADELLLTANSLVPTIGAGAAFLDGGIGFALSFANLPLHLADSLALFAAALTMICAALAAGRLTRLQLGPTSKIETKLGAALRAVLADLAAGAKYLLRRVTPGQALAVTALHRFLYGMVFICGILMSRNILAAPSTTGDSGAGLANFAIIMGLIGAGGAIAVVVTPVLSRNFDSQTWIAVMLGLAAISMVIMAIAPIASLIFTSTLLLGIAAQGAKIAVDTVVQRDTADSFRGRAFAFYDVVFNAAFVAAAVLAGWIVPDTGWARPLFLTLAAAYGLAAVVFAKQAARQPRDLTVQTQ
jgi:MFS family permease